MSNVLFTSLHAICVIIRDKKSNSLVLMKNVSAHVSEKIKIPYGHYTATVIGDDYNIQKEFKVENEDEFIQLY